MALLPTKPLAATAAPTPSVPLSQRQCFQMQFLLRLPGLEARHFIEAVKSLRDTDGDQDTTDRRIADLAGQARALRRDEARAFAQLAPLLKTMAATPELQTWAASEADRLSRPLHYTKDEQKDARTEPESAAILATLDEADALKTDTDARLSSLGLWIRLTQGRVGFWAADVGDMTAYLHAALVTRKEPLVSVTLARHLQDTAPPGTPAAVTDALALLAPQAGNLGGLAPDATQSIPLPAVSQAHDALLAAFHSQALAAPDADGAAPK